MNAGRVELVARRHVNADRLQGKIGNDLVHTAAQSPSRCLCAAVSKRIEAYARRQGLKIRRDDGIAPQQAQLITNGFARKIAAAVESE